MSDDEELIYKKPLKTIIYGSLETNDWVKQQTLEDIQSDEDEYEPDKKKPALGSTLPSVAGTAGTALPSTTIQPSANIHLSNEYFDLEQEM